jgi:hypothetical protein
MDIIKTQIETMNESLRQELLGLAREDLRVRDELTKTGELFEGYHPKMEAVHKRNAARLKEIIAEVGWPGKGLVGEDGADAAWLIFQHDIGEPEFIRSCVPALEDAYKKGEVLGKNYARTIDRILVYEGKPQKYGTNYDWDENRQLSPYPIEDPDKVDELREQVGLPPLAEDVAEKRQDAEVRKEMPPADYKAYKEKG